MLIFNRYEYNPQTDLIGKGGFSRVYKALDKKFNRYLALKVYKTSEMSERYSPIAEIQHVIELEHPNISRYIDIEEIEKEDSFGQVEKVQVFVMELLEGGNFTNYYNRTKDITVFKKLLIDVLHGLSYLHRNGIIHRNIKPANILIKQTIDGPVAKITDFGISKRSDSSTDSSSSALIVSIPYMAPEQLNAKKYGIDEKIHYNFDLWSLGVMVYEVLAGDVLFKYNLHDSSQQIMNNIVSNELPEKIRLLPSPFNEFVSKCIIKDSKERVKSAEDLIKILQGTVPETKTTITSGISGIQPGIAENNNDGFNEKRLTEAAEATIAETPDMANEDTHENENSFADDTVEISPKHTQTDRLSHDLSGSRNDESENPHVPISDVRYTDAPEKVPDDDPDATRIIVAAEAGKTDPESKGVSSHPEDADYETKIIPIEEERRNAGTGVVQPAVIKPEVRNPDPQNSSLHSQVETKIAHEQLINDDIEKSNIEAFEITGELKQNENDSTGSTTPKSDKEHTKITLFNRYDYYPVIDLIGKGGFSRVYKAFDRKLSRWVALKIYKTSEYSDRYSPIAEIRRVINLDHSNICRYLDIEEIEKVNSFGEAEKIQICVMELLDSGNFSDYFNRTGKDLDVMKKLLQDVLHGISYLHKNGIIHRDIKPANILIKKTIEGPVAKITDFGISKLSDSVNSNSSSALIVSIPYMAPEQLNAKKYGINEKISPNLDLWSLGVTIYEVITGKILFKNYEQDSSEQIMANIMAPELPDKINELSEPFKSIVAHCIIKNANERAQKAEELLALLNTTQAAPVVPAAVQPAEPVIKKESRFIVPANTEVKQPEGSSPPASVTPGEQGSKRKIRIAIPTPEIEKRAKKQISALKIGIAATTLLLLIAFFFYYNARRDEKKPTKAPVTRDTTAKVPALIINKTGDSLPGNATRVTRDSVHPVSTVNQGKSPVSQRKNRIKDNGSRLRQSK